MSNLLALVQVSEGGLTLADAIALHHWTPPMEANTVIGYSTDKVIHIDSKMLTLLFIQCKLSLLVVCTETFCFYHVSSLFPLPILF